jgi:hypothetical protein
MHKVEHALFFGSFDYCLQVRTGFGGSGTADGECQQPENDRFFDISSLACRPFTLCSGVAQVKDTAGAQAKNG